MTPIFSSKKIIRISAVAALLTSLTGCVLEPAPPPMMVGGPAPAYAATPCCYSYYDYPPYYEPYYYGPTLGIGVGGYYGGRGGWGRGGWGGGGGGHWR